MTRSNDKTKTSSRGSALLVVLGFLTFITISAVAFAIYMQVERAATSNYRHMITARHLLETALFRAMDEVDGELRIPNAKVRFPDWPGRVRASPAIVSERTDSASTEVNNRAQAQEARLLSVEALSFLPALIVNDVRANAVATRTNSAEDRIIGSKWRSLSMPIQHKIGIDNGVATNSAGQSIVGRYSYLCVNLSDMIDVNTASVLTRSVSNCVSIAHLFNNPTAFDTRRSNDVFYATLQDFYNCAGGQDPSGRGLFYGNSANCPYRFFTYGVGGNGSANIEFSGAESHVLVTDGLAKPEPRKDPSFNLRESPFNNLSNPQNSLRFKDDFKKALKAVFQNGPSSLPAGASEMLDPSPGLYGEGAFDAMVADYISKDVAPKRFDVPSCKPVPMVSQIQLTSLFHPVYYSEDRIISPGQKDTDFFVNMIGGAPGASPGISLDLALSTLNGGGVRVLLCYPFRNANLRSNPSFSVEVEGWIYVRDATALPTAASFLDTAGAVHFTGTKPVNLKSRSPNNMNDCFTEVNVGVSFEGGASLLKKKIATLPNGASTLAMEGSLSPNGNRTVVVLFARVLQDGVVVDSVPQHFPYPAGIDATLPPVLGYGPIPKLYFPSQSSGPVMSATPNPVVRNLEWYALAVPDPRFNHRAANWLKIPAASSSDTSINLGPLTTLIAGLLGHEGRDSDIFMSVSGTGVLQSPGELGFIIRPYKFDRTKGSSVDFNTRTTTETGIDDSAAYFRTIRLYNHTATGLAGNSETETYDPVYEYFYAAEPDGICTGSRTRVNPLSPLDIVLEAAIDHVPYDYWVATENARTDSNKSKNFNELLGPKWEDFLNDWLDAVTNKIRTANVGWRFSPDRSYTSIRSVYPELQSLVSPRGWYVPGASPNDRGAIFGQSGLGNLYEVDRKMLYAFSLDAFSDRQQLFLYIVQAEAIAPMTGAEAKSLAGGKAIALVWRDPYPSGAKIRSDNKIEGTTGVWYDKASNGFANQSCYEDRLSCSPWWKWRSEAKKSQPHPGNWDKGYYEQRILFFKQLNN